MADIVALGRVTTNENQYIILGILSLRIGLPHVITQRCILFTLLRIFGPHGAIKMYITYLLTHSLTHSLTYLLYNAII